MRAYSLLRVLLWFLMLEGCLHLYVYVLWFDVFVCYRILSEGTVWTSLDSKNRQTSKNDINAKEKDNIRGTRHPIRRTDKPYP